MLGHMKKTFLAALFVVSLLPAPTRAQVAAAAVVQLSVALPTRPPLVTVQPGIQVVENWDEEVFYTGGYYWVRRDGYWYRATGPRARFAYVEPRRVPPGLERIPPGHYRHWRKEQAKAERREWKERERQEREARRDLQREHREHEGRGNGHGNGHGHGHGHD